MKHDERRADGRRRPRAAAIEVLVKLDAGVTDAKLFLDGGERAMTELVGRYERPLFRFLASIVGESHLAEDLFQETFLRLCRYRSSFRAGSRLRPYLYRIAVNVARDAIARRRARPKAASLEAGPDGGAPRGASLAETLPGDSPDPEAAGERRELKVRVREAVRSLPDAEREVVHLRVFEGLRFAEIAEAAGVPLATAKSRMLYALRRLRPVLEAYVSGGEMGKGPAR